MRCRDIAGVRIESKRQVSEGHIRQAVLELTANCLSNYSIVIILIDLGQECFFHWISTDSIQESPQDLQGGVVSIDAIEYSLDQRCIIPQSLQC